MIWACHTQLVPVEKKYREQQGRRRNNWKYKRVIKIVFQVKDLKKLFNTKETDGFTNKKWRQIKRDIKRVEKIKIHNLHRCWEKIAEEFDTLYKLKPFEYLYIEEKNKDDPRYSSIRHFDFINRIGF